MERYALAAGKFGIYFVDRINIMNANRGAIEPEALTLEHVCYLLNEAEELRQERKEAVEMYRNLISKHAVSGGMSQEAETTP